MNINEILVGDVVQVRFYQEPDRTYIGTVLEITETDLALVEFDERSDMLVNPEEIVDILDRVDDDREDRIFSDTPLGEFCSDGFDEEY